MTKLYAPSQVSGRAVGRTGFGLMGLTRYWDPIEYPAAAKVLKTALQNGANFWNAATFYGPPDANSLQLLKYYFEKYPEDADKVVLSLKGAYDASTHTPYCSPESINASVEGALAMLDGVKKIDIFECARVDPKVPIEVSMEAMKKLVAAGKIGAIGLSEVSASTIRRAHAVHPVVAVEVELSLFTTDPLTNGIADTCRELGIALVGYSPLGSGFLTGKIRRFEDIPEGSWLRFYPRFQPAVFDENLQLVRAVEAIAETKGATSGQVAIAWVRSKGSLPIPGATTVERVIENCTEVVLSDEELAELQKIIDSLPVSGERYPEPLASNWGQ